MIFALLLITASSSSTTALLISTERDKLPTKIASDSVMGVKEFDSHAYVTYVRGSDYMEHAIILTATLNETGSLKNYPLVYMVREGSQEQRVAQLLQAKAATLGWNMKIQSYKPVDIRFHTAYDFWDEAWQRVTLYGMGSRFGRVLHVDADAYAFRNAENILVNAKVPTVARRQSGCREQQNVCSPTPVSNFMLISPNATRWEQIVNKIKNWNTADKGPDETVQFSLYHDVHLLSPSQVSYFDCFMNLPDSNLTASGFDVNNLPGIVHLGIPGKAMIKNFKKQGSCCAGHQFQQKMWDKTKAIYASTEVQAMLKVLIPESQRIGVKSAFVASDICD